MWGALAVAAISAYAANGGKLSGWNVETQDDWMGMEERRMERLQREAKSVRMQALFGAVLMVALVAALIYMVAA